MDHQHSKVERFLKLGYSHSDILRVLESLRHDAQTNDILEELIKTCHSRGDSNRSSSTSSPKLVPRGCSLPDSCPSPKHPLPRPSPTPDREPADNFRSVVIDGSNVAMSHGDKKVFSCRGLQLAVKWFLYRGLRDITVFVPLWRKEQPRPEAPITDQQILHDLERRKILVYTPSRCVNGKRVVCYDDRYIVKLAFDSDGIIVSNDNYRDLQTENPHWKRFIEERLLMYTFANDKFMPPDDPLGRNGPTIDNFLRKKPLAQDKQQHCPYEKKCTYGVKCKFYHPERVNKSQLSVADELRAMSRPAADRALPPGQATSYGLYPEAEHNSGQLHKCQSSSPPPLCKEDQSGRSPEQFARIHYCPSPDIDEAFGSLESQMPKLYIQDVAQSTRHSYAYSSGIGSYGQSNEPFLSSGSYSSSNNCRPNSVGNTSPVGYHPRHGHACEHTSQCPHNVVHRPTGNSCPVLLPRGSPTHFSDNQCYRAAFPHRHSLPEDQWGGQYWHRGLSPDMRSAGQAKTPASEEDHQRRAVRSQLSTLFPPSTVEQVMSTFPHILDMAKLISLIQRYRTNDISF